MTKGPLDGIRVTDFGWILSVPHATAWLGSLGADVVRVESALRPDLLRVMGETRGADGVNGINRSGSFNGLNYSKRGVTLNLKHPRGLELARELVRCSDIVTENFQSGVIAELGLGYEALCELRPDLIMMSGSPLGQTGPESHSSGWGPTTMAYTGLPAITGYRDGPPASIGGAYPDFVIGVQMAFALLAALHERGRSGRGQYIDVAMGETVMAMTPEPVLEHSMNGRELERRGNRHPYMAPHGVYRCAGDDSWVAISVESDAQWRRLRELLGDPQWARDDGLDDQLQRHGRQDELDRGLAAWTAERTHYEVMQLLAPAGIPAAPCLSAEELSTDPQMAGRGFFAEVDHAELGPRRLPGIPGRFSHAGFEYGPTPTLGQHNHDVFCGLLGLPEDELQQLIDDGVVC